jgi:hypothetical protein
MPNPNLRSWTEADNAKLKSLAGKLRPAEIAAELERFPLDMGHYAYPACRK